jgi:hypothetical protein
MVPRQGVMLSSNRRYLTALLSNGHRDQDALGGSRYRSGCMSVRVWSACGRLRICAPRAKVTGFLGSSRRRSVRAPGPGCDDQTTVRRADSPGQNESCYKRTVSLADRTKAATMSAGPRFPNPPSAWQPSPSHRWRAVGTSRPRTPPSGRGLRGEPPAVQQIRHPQPSRDLSNRHILGPTCQRARLRGLGR